MADPVPHQIRFNAEARAMLLAVTDRRVQAQIVQRAEQLALEPEKQGKPLIGDLRDYRSVRAVGQRYRILYRVDQSVVTVMVVALDLRKEGSRRDIYALAQKLLSQGLLDPPQAEAD